MTIPSFKILKKNADERVAAAENSKKIVLIYVGAVTVLALLVTVVNYALKLQISQLGGLSNMGLRSVLSTVQSVLPMLQSVVTLCLQLGYMAAMLRVARQQYASEQTLKLGFDRFWVLLRYVILESCLYTLAGLAAFWIAVQVYLLTPLSRSAISMVTPEMADPNVIIELLQDPVFAGEITAAMLPLFVLFGILYTVLFVPINYSLRMGRYVLIDKPGQGAVFAMKESRNMMRGSRIRLFKLDVSLWWWYAISVISSLLCYGDVLLPMVGVELPFSADVSYFLFYGLFLVAQFLAAYFFGNYIQVVYAQVYNALKPREKDTGVVLGNIFQM
ncbi:MAG: DUF975 family protein [Oscillospiraceae bacterium]|nr:DUF975 family protein [Oscillospiraceae bacterium]